MKKITSLLLSVSFWIGGAAHALAQSSSYELPPESAREALYAEKRVDASAMAFANLLPFAPGSFGAGDWVSGSFISAFDVAALALLAYGAVEAGSTGGWSLVFGVGSGTLAYAGGRLIGLTTPWFYAPGHNARLRDELGLSPMNAAHREIPQPLLSYSFAF